MTLPWVAAYHQDRDPSLDNDVEILRNLALTDDFIVVLIGLCAGETSNRQQSFVRPSLKDVAPSEDLQGDYASPPQTWS